MLRDADDIEVTAQEMVRFYGEDARFVAVKNIMLRGRTDEWRKFWFAVWKALPEVEIREFRAAVASGRYTTAHD